MNLKRTLTSIAAASLVLGTMAPVAMAATPSNTYFQRHIDVNGQNVANPWGIVRGGTNYFPIWYLQSNISKLIPGATAHWDGTSLYINVPGLSTSNLTGPTVPGPNGIYINGTLTERFTKIVADDHGTKIQTSYAPIVALFDVLKQLGLKSSWNADGVWGITPAVTMTSLKIAGNNNLNLGGSDTLTLTATDSAGNAMTVDPSKVMWSVNNSGVISNSGVFAATTAGTFTVTATYMGMTATANVVVSGQATSYKVTSSATSLLADGTSYNTITVAAIDKNGNTDTNYNGTAVVSDTASLIAAATKAGDQPSDFNSSNNQITFTNGVATLAVGPTTTVNASDTVTVADTSTSSPLTSSSYTFSTVAPSLTKLALAVATGSPTAISANGQYSTNLTLSAEDAAGNTFPGQPGTYVTLTLTGPGSFVAGTTAVTSETMYVPTSGSLPVTVYSMPGMQGTVTVSATSTGLTGATATVPTYINTAAGSISVTSTTGTDTNGNPYTQYTVQLLDSNGHPITSTSANDAFTVTDNSSAASGVLQYGTVNSSGVFTASKTSSTGITGNLVNGIATFAVETNTVGTTPTATLTINDTTNSFTQTATYSYAPGAATQVAVSPSSLYVATPGQTVTFSAQLEDANGNDVSKAGVPVTFSFAKSLSGVQFPTGQSTYTVNTDSSGVATVSFTIPTSSAGGSLELAAASSGLTSGNSALVNVLAATNSSNYATQVVIQDSSSNTVSSITEPAGSGSITSAVYNAVAQNAVGTTVGTNDVFSVSSSNTNVVSVTNSTVTSTAGVANIAKDLVVGMAGSAVITVKDISNQNAPVASFTVNVTPGTATGYVVEYNGAPISSSNSVTLTAGQPIMLQVVNADTAGDPIPVVGSSAVTVSVYTGAGITGDFRLTPSGAPITSVTLNPGQASTSVYFVPAANETLNSATNLTAK